jgi:hypothetical protein
MTEDGENLNHVDSEDYILNLIHQKADISNEIAQIIIDEPKLLKVVFKGVFALTARIKFRSAKILKIISLKDPELLIPHWDFFVDLLDTDNSIILWNDLDVIANLTAADQENMFDDIFQIYYQFLEDESMVTAAHVVDNSAKIAKNRPELQTKITKKLLMVGEIPRDGECQDILSGKAILVFDKYFSSIDNKEEVISFTKKQSTSQRNATKVKAEKFLKKHEDD